MKKSSKLFIFALIAIFAGTIGVKAMDVTNATNLKSCLGTKGNTCVLTEDVTLDDPIDIDVDGNVTLDLNGHSIKASSTMKYKGGMLIVFHGTTLTINDATGKGEIATSGENKNVYAAVMLTKNGENDDTKAAKLVVNGGHLFGYFYGIVGNGSNAENNRRGNTEVTINGGKIEAVEGPAIYQPQIGTMTINDGEIKGLSGVEVRSGNLVVNGGTITGSSDADKFKIVKNASGTTTDGVGLAVVQHTTKNNISIEINGGKISGYHGLYEMNIEGNTGIEDKLTFKITGGTFEGLGNGNAAPYAIFVEDAKSFITGGTYNHQVMPIFVAENYKVTESGDNYVVEANKSYVSEDGKVGFESETPFPTDYTLEVVALDKTKIEAAEKTVAAAYKDSKVAKDVKLLALYDINVLDVEGEVVTVEEGKYKVSLAIDKSMQKYDSYKVLYMEDGKIKETLDAKLVDGKIVFETTHFSEYAVVGYNNAKVENPKTLDNIALFISVAVVASAGAVISSKKLLKNM